MLRSILKMYYSRPFLQVLKPVPRGLFLKLRNHLADTLISLSGYTKFEASLNGFFRGGVKIVEDFGRVYPEEMKDWPTEHKKHMIVYEFITRALDHIMSRDHDALMAGLNAHDNVEYPSFEIAYCTFLKALKVRAISKQMLGKTEDLHMVIETYR